MTTITVKLYGLWRAYLGTNSLSIDADDVDGALTKLDETFSSQLENSMKKGGLKVTGQMKTNSVVLLNGINLRNLKETRLKPGDVLDIFPPIGGG